MLLPHNIMKSIKTAGKFCTGFLSSVPEFLALLLGVCFKRFCQLGEEIGGAVLLGVLEFCLVSLILYFF